MPEPVTIFTIGTTAVTLADAFVAVGATVGALGAIQAGNAAHAQAGFQSQVLQQQAEQERTSARQTEEDFRREQSRLFASRRAMLGGSGVDPTAGSPLLVSEDFASESELQALRIRAGGEMRATRLGQEAELTRMAGSDARRAGFVRSGSLLLSGAGTVFGQLGTRLSGPRTDAAGRILGGI